MDIYRFINSRDIRQHLMDLKYDFTPLEAAWLIYQCRSVSLEEKWAAWEELIRTMPDFRVEERPNTVGWQSLHSLLKAYMALQHKIIDRLRMPEEGTIYIVRDCGSDVVEYCSSYGHALGCLSGIAWKTSEVSICKQWLDSDRLEQIEARMRPDGTMMGIMPYPYGITLTDEENDILRRSFDGLWFDFPTPFHKGDILYDISDKVPNPFVMTAIGTSSLSKKTILHHRKNGDTTDMNARGYYAGGIHGFYKDDMYNYMDCEYYTGELRHGKAILSSQSVCAGKSGTGGTVPRLYSQPDGFLCRIKCREENTQRRQCPSNPSPGREGRFSFPMTASTDVTSLPLSDISRQSK